MYCKKCGAQVGENQPFCPNCGAGLSEMQAASANGHHGYVGFGQAIKLFFTNYANFSGRASKSEFWWAYLLTAMLSIPSLLCMIPYLGWILALIVIPVGIALLIPTVALAFRRLHDVGRSGAYWLMGFIPFAGPILVIIEYLKPSVGDNQWGPGPQ